MVGQIDVDLTWTRQYVDTSIQVNNEIKSKFLNFRPTLYLLKTAFKSVFPRELSFFYNAMEVKGSYTISTSKSR